MDGANGEGGASKMQGNAGQVNARQDKLSIRQRLQQPREVVPYLRNANLLKRIFLEIAHDQHVLSGEILAVNVCEALGGGGKRRRRWWFRCVSEFVGGAWKKKGGTDGKRLRTENKNVAAIFLPVFQSQAQPSSKYSRSRRHTLPPRSPTSPIPLPSSLPSLHISTILFPPSPNKHSLASRTV